MIVLKLGRTIYAIWSDIPPNTGNPAEPSFQAKIILLSTDPKRAGPLPPKPTSLAVESPDYETVLLHLSSKCLPL